jgi:uncharacterized protein
MKRGRLGVIDINTNAELMRKMFDAFASGDMETLLKSYSEDVVFRSGGRGVVAGEYRGRAGLQSYLEKIFVETDGTITVDLIDVSGSDEYGYTHFEASAQRKGRSVVHERMFIVARVENDLVVESWMVPADAVRSDEFWA